MEYSHKIREDLILDGKDFDLIVENDYYYVLLMTMLECYYWTHIKQFLLFHDFLKSFNKDTLEGVSITMATFRKIYATFQINSSIVIRDFDAYYQKIQQELETERDPIIKRKKTQIFSEFNILINHVHPVSQPSALPTEYQRNCFIINRDTVPFQECNHAFNYCKEDILIVIDIASIVFSKEDLNAKLKVIFDNLIDISSEFEVSNITYEISKSSELLFELSDWKEEFKIPFVTVGKNERVNLIRLMKYWEVSGDIKVEDWIWDDTGWNIKILRKEENSKIEYFLSAIENFKFLAREWVLETSKEQDLLREIREFQYEVIENNEIFLLKAKKLKAHPQTIWSSHSSRWFSNAVSPYILEWENIFREYFWKNNAKENSHEIEIAKIENIKPWNNTNEVIFDSSTWRVWQNWVKICELTIGKAPYKFFKYLYENKWKVLNYDELKNEVNSWQMNTTSAKYCQKLKNWLDERIKKYIKPNGIWFIFDLE